MKKYNMLFIFTMMVSSLCLASGALALTLTDSIEFMTTNQSMWQEGAAASWKGEYDLSAKWGTYNGDEAASASVGFSELGFSARVGASSSGQIGIVPWAEASGGGLDITVPMDATLTLPDIIEAGSTFTISTAGTIQSGAKITTDAPTFKAGIDGLFDLENRLYASASTPVGCGTFGLSSCSWSGGIDLNLNLGRFDLFGIDLSSEDALNIFGLDVPLPGYGREFYIRAPSPENPDGVDDEITPEINQARPIIGDLMITPLQDFSGGSVHDNSLSLTTNQAVIDAQVSLTGLIEAGGTGANVALLRNEITLLKTPVKDIKARWTLADVSVGLSLGMQQDFDFDSETKVRLQFDKPVTQMVQKQVVVYKEVCSALDICLPFPTIETRVVPERHEDGIVEITLGSDVELMFDDEDGVGNLIDRTYFLDNANFTNDTYATIDPALQVQALCASVPIAGSFCAYDETFQTTGLLRIGLYSNTWSMGGFNTVNFAETITYNNGAVPEPSTLFLLAIGIIGIAGFTARKRK